MQEMRIRWLTDEEMAEHRRKQEAAEERRKAAAVRAHRRDVWPRRGGVVDDIDDTWWSTDDLQREYRRLRIDCPRCGRWHFPFRSRRTRLYEYGSRWQGFDCMQPYWRYLCRCPHCRILYRLGMHTSQ